MGHRHVGDAVGADPWEDRTNQSFYAARTRTLDSVSHLGRCLAETVTCIVLFVILTVVFRVWLGRWRESATLVASMVGEVLLFLAVTTVVNRPRPGVPQLNAAPPTSS